LEATGYSRWFERLLAELGFEVWIGDAAEIKRQRGRKQKTDREDAQLLLQLLLENRFPKIWVPSPENRDLRQLLWHRRRLVQMRARIMNQLQAVAMNEGYRWKKKLFSEKGRVLLEKLPLAPWARRRRKELLELLDQLDPKIAELTAAPEREAQQRPEVVRLMTHPGVGPLTGLAYVLVSGTPDRFPCGKKIGSYTGLIPSEDSSAGHQRLGHVSKQGNTLLRFLLGEAAQAAARCTSNWYPHYCFPEPGPFYEGEWVINRYFAGRRSRMQPRDEVEGVLVASSEEAIPQDIPHLARIIVTLLIFDSRRNTFSTQFRLPVDRRERIAREKMRQTTEVPYPHCAGTSDEPTVEALPSVGSGTRATR
jgi:transposase